MQSELVYRISQETPKNSLDLRSRLSDSQGRQGKILDYK